MGRRLKRNDIATMNPNIMKLFEEFYNTGQVERVFPERRDAEAARERIYTARMLLEEAHARGDDIALSGELTVEQLFTSAREMYVQIAPLNLDRKKEHTKLTIKVAPLTRIDHPDNPTPWKLKPGQDPFADMSWEGKKES